MVSSKKFITVISTVGLSAATTYSLPVAAQTHEEDELQEIVVTSAFQQSEAETALPIGILSGEALREQVGNSLGETLRNEIGISNSSFGTGVGHPVIRGQSGNRVKVLQNGIGVTDASKVSPDHAEGVESIMAERIEVIRGPSTLLYGSGAIGGVVNVIDNRIPEQLVEETQFSIQQTRNSVNEEDKTVISLDASSGNFAFHLDAFRRENDNVDIKGFAIDEFSVEELEELVEHHLEEEGHHDDDHDDHDDHDDEEFENTRGFIGNSDAEADGATAGFSWVTDNGFIGFSVSELNNEYGLPPGAHNHAHGEDHHDEDEDHHDEDEDHHDEDEDHHDEDEDHHDEDEDHHDEDEHEEVEAVRIDMEQTRYDFRAGYDFNEGFFQSFRGSLGLTDYEHSEIEYFEDGDSHVGTRFSNEGLDGRFTLTHRPVGDWTGVWGLQFEESEFSATGEEAFIPESDISSLGFFGVERYINGPWTAELGFRFEQNDVDPNGSCDYDGDTSSFSGSFLYDLDGESNLLIGASRSQRAPSVEELFSNTSSVTCAPFADDEDLVLHAATALLETGNPLLDEESSNNLEFGYRRHSGAVTGEFSAYYNQIDDFIYLDLTGEAHEGQNIASYFQKDATFKGVEGEVTLNLLDTSEGSLAFSVFGDLVDAEFDRGGNIPRIAPSKAGAKLRYFGNDWSLHLHITRYGEQDDVGELELATPGYTLISVYADYHLSVGNSDLKLFVRGDNLRDEEIRNHTSFLKNYAPEAGRGVTLGVRFDF